jgi:Tol biopolymer transport system component
LLAAGPAGVGDRPGTWALSTLTGEIRKLADDGYLAVFSPDDRQVAFISARMNELWLMGSKGENPRKLVTASAGDAFIGLAWSPDGARVAALKIREADFRASAIEAYAVGSGARAEILAEPRVSAFAWKADGRLVYAQGAAAPLQESYGLWEVTLDNRGTRPAEAPRQLAAWMSQSAESLSVSRDGTRVLVTRGRTRSNVFVGQLNAMSTELSNVRQLTRDDRVNWPSAWTPDGRAILFHADRNGDFDLFRQSFADREAQPLLLGSDEVRSARVTPDGKWILHLALVPPSAGAATTRVRLMRMPAGGGPPEQVLETAGNWGRGDSIVTVDGDYFWSFPDFRCAASMRPAACVISEADGPRETVFTAVDPLRGRAGEIARVKVPAQYLMWDLSPDGSRLAYASTSFYPGVTETVQVLALADRSTRDVPLRDYSGMPGGIAWTATGDALLIAGLAVRGGTLLSMDLNGRKHALLDFAGKGLYLADPRPSPDGRQLAFGQAWLLEPRQ